jgi:hypothetical protein
VPPFSFGPAVRAERCSTSVVRACAKRLSERPIASGVGLARSILFEADLILKQGCSARSAKFQAIFF